MRRFRDVTFTINGHPLTVKVSNSEHRFVNGNALPYGHVRHTEVAAAVRQYAKAVLPKSVKAWVRSESFAGGNAVDVYIDGAAPEVFEEISAVAEGFQMGHFDGMIDLYEYTDNHVYATDGTRLDFYAKYVSVGNTPPWDVRAKREAA